MKASYYSSQWLHGGIDLSNERYHPNGDFSFHHRCDFDYMTGRQMTCVADSHGHPVCILCGNSVGGTDTHTEIGCRPEGVCPPGTDLWPNGRCWSADDGLPDWMCEADCESMYNWRGWCMNGIDWRMMMQGSSVELSAYPWQDEQYNHYRPICASWDCDGDGAECASQGMSCDPDPGNCVIECIHDSDCQAIDPVPSYPNGFYCDTSLTCVWNP